MFGWEFPPHTVGGLGNVTYNLTNSLLDMGMKITLVLPISSESDRMKIVSTNLNLESTNILLMPYMTEENYLEQLEERFREEYIHEGDSKKDFNLSKLDIARDLEHVYRGDLFCELEIFARRCIPLIKKEEFDVIHCHDWLTFRAGVVAKEISGKPLIFHVHTTELDRSCGQCNQRAYDLERECFEKADKIIAVSQYTKDKLVSGYGVPPEKVEVVHNAITFDGQRKPKDIRQRKIVLYFGRLSLHKGPDYFIRAAKKVLEYDDDVIFVVAGGGEMMPDLIQLACALGLGNKIIFTGKLTDEEVEKIYRAADVYVMPSISEPFGITALEAAAHGTPVIISKNAGAKEILQHCLAVDFWDTEEIAHKILALLKYPQVGREMATNSYQVLDKVSWRKQAENILKIYQNVV